MKSASIYLFLAAAIRTNGQLVAKTSLRALSKVGPDFLWEEDLSMSMMSMDMDAVAGIDAITEASGGKSSKSGKTMKRMMPFTKSGKSIESMTPVTAAGPSPLAPFCPEVGANCTSGELLEGVGRSERNVYSDTIDGCDDGTLGVYLEDESVEKITVSSVDGQALQVGRMAKIEAVVSPWVTVPSSSIAHFYYAETVSTQFTPEWVYLGFVNPSNDVGTGLQTLEMTFTPSKGGIQAVRVNFGLFLPEGPCVIDDQQTNDYVDHDDLIFTVAKGSGKEASPSKPDHAVVVPPAPHVDASRICASLVQWKHCAKASRICQWSGESCSPKGD